MPAMSDGATMEASPRSPGTDRFPLEIEQPLSRSLLWSMQRAFFERQGIEAWRLRVVPQYVTTNAFIAHAYAGVVAAFLRDCRAAGLDQGGPVHVVELGGGSGRFAFTFLKKLLRRAPDEARRVRYVLTDFTGTNVAFWRSHSAFTPLVDAGLLDFAVFDGERDQPLRLEVSGETLAHGALKSPLVAIANYFFDTLSQEAFAIEGAEVREYRVSLFSPHAEPVPDDPAILGRLSAEFSTGPVSREHAEDPEVAALLDAYRGRFARATVCLPIGGLRCCRALRRLSGDRLLLLSCDKGDVHESDVARDEPPGYALHGSFSFSVNYHAVAAWFRNAGGQAWHTTHAHRSVAVVACQLGVPGTETRRAFEEEMATFGPDDFFSFKHMIEGLAGLLTVPQILAWLRLAKGDAGALWICLPALRDKLGDASAQQRADLKRILAETWDLHYALEVDRDLPFEIGRLFYGMGDAAHAVPWFERSMALHGESPGAHVNLGLCSLALGDAEGAMRFARRALAEDPEHDAARALCDAARSPERRDPPSAATVPRRRGDDAPRPERADSAPGTITERLSALANRSAQARIAAAYQRLLNGAPGEIPPT
jgi:tetratricopeptide (TPR) repeat protein